jgi:hypothetical protein
MVRNATSALLGLVLTALPAGCGKAAPPAIVEAEGIVRLNGKPLAKATVRFIPQNDLGAEYVATGVTDGAGRFTLTCNGKLGACAGENRVLVMESPLPARVRGEDAQVELAKYLQSLGGRPIPPKYANLADSPLTANVTADKKEHVLELSH